MPMYEFSCLGCTSQLERYVPADADKHTVEIDCDTCAERMVWAGLSAFAIRAPHPTGGYANGKFYPGTFGVDPPGRKKRNIKTFR